MKSVTFLIGAMILLTSCASYKPLDVQAIDEIPVGPGLFSGESGEFEVYRKRRSG